MERNADDDDNILTRVRREATEKIAASGGAMIEAKAQAGADIAKRYGVSPELIDRVLPPPPPPKAPAPFIFSDEDVAEIRDQKEQFAYLQNALDLLRRQTPSAPPARAERPPELSRTQRRADLLSELKPLLVEEETEREKARLARRAMKRMAKRR